MYGVETRSSPATGGRRGRPTQSTLIGTIYEGYPVNAAYRVTSPDSWVFRAPACGRHQLANLVGIEYETGSIPPTRWQRPIEVLSHSPLSCQGKASYGDSAYYTHSGGAGVFNSGTMRWVEAIYGDRPHGIDGAASSFVWRTTANILRAFAEGPAAAAHPARDNLDAMHEQAGDPACNLANLQ